MMPVGTNSDEFANRSEYLAHLQELSRECQTQTEAVEAGPPDVSQQLAMLAEALERLAIEVSEMRAMQDSSAGVVLGLERRVTALEQATPSPQSWRDLIQGIRGIREVVAAQAVAARQNR